MLVLKPIVNDQTSVDLKTTLADTWRAMIKLQETGKVRGQWQNQSFLSLCIDWLASFTNKFHHPAIGVSNCTQVHLEALIKATGVKPSVNQVDLHDLLA